MKQILLLLLLAFPAYADHDNGKGRGHVDNPETPPPSSGDVIIGVETNVRTNNEVRTNSESRSNSNSESSSSSNSDSTSNSASNSSSNSTNDVSGSGNSSINSSDEYFAFATTFPNATDCFGGVEGAGAGSFLGFHKLNSNCWLVKISDSEKDIDIKARLKCGSKMYRNAISYDQRVRDRQEHCIGYVSEIWKKQLLEEKKIAKKCSTGVCSYVNGQLHYYLEGSNE